MTLADLRKRVMIDKLDDEDYEPEIIDNFLNDAQRDILKQYDQPFKQKNVRASSSERLRIGV